MKFRTLFCFSISIVLLGGTTFAATNEGELLDDEEHSPFISNFKNKFCLRFLTLYNFISLWSSNHRDVFLVSNRPVDVGLGFGYGDLYFDLNYSLPFTISDGKSESPGFEMALDFFPGEWWVKLKYRRNSGFTYSANGEDYFVDYWQREMYISGLWMATAKKEFTPRAAYFLDRQQKLSSGSVVVGARLQHNSSQDRSNFLMSEEEHRDITSIWTDMGYSYTWIFSSQMFFNLWGVVGVAAGNEANSDDAVFLPEANIKMAYGHFGEEWSWNVVLQATYVPVMYENHWEQEFINSFTILVVRRF
ncbi:MAG: DUF4421 family protein [Fibrobacteraceae bacterium]|nr:DUF4421 family protein [Fibrobacteraceae bacterium]